MEPSYIEKQDGQKLYIHPRGVSFVHDFNQNELLLVLELIIVFIVFTLSVVVLIYYQLFTCASIFHQEDKATILCVGHTLPFRLEAIIHNATFGIDSAM